MRGGTWVGATSLLAGLALVAATAALAQAPGSSSSSSSSSGGASASASANAGASSSSSSSSSSAGGGGGGQQQQQQQQQGGGGVVIVTAPPVAVHGGGMSVVGGSGYVYGGPVTQLFTPPREIILSSRPTRVYAPRVVSRTRVVVVRSRPTVTYASPPRGGNLPFTGMNTTLGLIVGFGLVCGGALLLVRRRDEALDRALAEQASALVALTSR